MVLEGEEEPPVLTLQALSSGGARQHQGERLQQAGRPSHLTREECATRARVTEHT